MFRHIVAQLRRRPRRAMALLAGVLAATTGFTVASGATATSRLTVVGTVNDTYRAAYDILVRPAGARSTMESERGLIRPNYLSGLFGGITMAQYQQVRQIPGVEVAAPIAMIGYATMDALENIDVTDAIDRNLTRQLIRVTTTWSSDRGLSRVTDDAPTYVYVTSRPVIWPELAQQGSAIWSDGKDHTDEVKKACHADTDTIVVDTPLEVREDGSLAPICSITNIKTSIEDKSAAAGRVSISVFQLLADGRFQDRSGRPTARAIVSPFWPMTLLLAAVDPDQEARLVGLDRAMKGGSYLTAPFKPSGRTGPRATTVPVIASDQSYLDEITSAVAGRLTGPLADHLAGSPPQQTVAQLGAASGLTPVPAGSESADKVYEPGVPTANQPLLTNSPQSVILQSGSTTYDTDGSALVPRSVTLPSNVWEAGHVIGVRAPIFGKDVAFRQIQPVMMPQNVFLQTVGTFDPNLLTSFSAASQLPLETYFPPLAQGADDRSRALLKGQPLGPNNNPAGYLATPPALLTSLDQLAALGAGDAPLSAIRVRVADIRGLDARSQERIRLIAQEITEATGLDVDITIGSSSAPQTVKLPAGSFGRPELSISEGWSKKGVAVAIISAIDRKSAILFGLILVVCTLFLANAVSAAVRDRRRELAVLACLGWPRRRLMALIGLEVGAVGLLAGVAGAGLTPLVARAANIQTSGRHALLAIPVAVGISLLAAAVPAWRAGQAHPGVLVSAQARAPRGSRRHRRTVAGLAIANLPRTPGRSLMAVLALTLAIASLTLLLAITFAFQGEITGTVMGNLVTVRARGVDGFAVGVSILLGLIAVADVLYLNTRERSGELAALAAAGWSQSVLGRLIAYEGLFLGSAGALLGAGLGLSGASLFVGTLAPNVISAASLAAVIGVLATAIAAWIPTLWPPRMSISTLLAED
jgi:hypothetical protein